MNRSSHNSPISQRVARIGARAAIALAIGGGHVMVGMSWFMSTVELRTQDTASAPMYAEFIADEPPLDTIHRVEPLELVRSIELPIPELPETAVASLTEDPAIEVPKIDPLVGPDVSPYSARANLAPGQTATVLLTVNIGADGAVISAEIVRSSGDESVNAAAVDYARATRWIPGTIGGVPRPMQASLTVILGENA